MKTLGHHFLNIVAKTFKLVGTFLVVTCCCHISSAQSFLVSNLGDNSIHRFSMAGQDQGVFANTSSKPYGLAVDFVGNVYVALPFQGGIIQKYSSTGANLGVFANVGGFSEH